MVTKFKKSSKRKKKSGLRVRKHLDDDKVETIDPQKPRCNDSPDETTRIKKKKKKKSSSSFASRSMLSFGESENTVSEFKVKKSKLSRQMKKQARANEKLGRFSGRPTSTYTQVSGAGMYSKNAMDALKEKQSVLKPVVGEIIAPAMYEDQVEDDHELKARIQHAKEARAQKKELLTRAQEYIPLSRNSKRMASTPISAYLGGFSKISPAVDAQGLSDWEAQQIRRASKMGPIGSTIPIKVQASRASKTLSLRSVAETKKAMTAALRQSQSQAGERTQRLHQARAELKAAKKHISSLKASLAKMEPEYAFFSEAA